MCVKKTNMHIWVQGEKAKGKESSNWNVWTKHNSIMATSLCFREFYALFWPNLTVAVLAEFVSWECVSTLAVRLSSDYLNEMLTVPEASHLRSGLRSIWGTPAVLTITPVFFFFLKAGSIHPASTPTHISPHKANWKRLISNTIKPRNICHCGGRNES